MSAQITRVIKAHK